MQIRIRHLSRATPETVQRAMHAFAAPIENMGIDHRGFDIVVAQELLYGSDIMPVLQQMCRKGMAKCMRRGVLDHTGPD